MGREVLFARRAEQDFDETFNWYAERSEDAAALWLGAVHRAIQELEVSADRLPYSQENDRFPLELRQLVFRVGAKPTHRMVFAIRDERVVVYAIRHLAQDDLKVGDV
jgi:plasmid stabilization system protein ParE